MYQSDLIEACERRDLGMQRAVDRADREHERWSDLAAQVLRSYALRHDEFLAEHVIAWAVGLIPPAPDKRAWGAIFTRAAKRGLIVKAGYSANTLNRCAKPLWRAVKR